MLPHAREQGVIFELELNEDLQDICFDEEAIYRCLLNLVSNAIDDCTDVSCLNKQTKVILRSLQAEGWAAEYQVIDDGCGMDEDTRAKIFQSFFSTKGSKGTGLGLMITKKIIDEHGGVIELESERGEGTKFIIRLPERDQPDPKSVTCGS